MKIFAKEVKNRYSSYNQKLKSNMCFEGLCIRKRCRTEIPVIFNRLPLNLHLCFYRGEIRLGTAVETSGNCHIGIAICVYNSIKFRKAYDIYQTRMTTKTPSRLFPLHSTREAYKVTKNLPPRHEKIVI